jgi:hypothetical protein
VEGDHRAAGFVDVEFGPQSTRSEELRAKRKARAFGTFGVPIRGRRCPGDETDEPF